MKTKALVPATPEEIEEALNAWDGKEEMLEAYQFAVYACLKYWRRTSTLADFARQVLVKNNIREYYFKRGSRKYQIRNFDSWDFLSDGKDEQRANEHRIDSGCIDLSVLTPVEREVIRHLYGMDGYEQIGLRECAARMGWKAKSTAQEYRDEAFIKLRKQLAANEGKTYKDSFGNAFSRLYDKSMKVRDRQSTP